LIFIQQEDYLRLVVPLDQLGGMGCFIYKDHYAIGVVTVDGYEYGFDLCRTEDSVLFRTQVTTSCQSKPKNSEWNRSCWQKKLQSKYVNIVVLETK
jgi:hypothetical protein